MSAAVEIGDLPDVPLQNAEEAGYRERQYIYPAGSHFLYGMFYAPLGSSPKPSLIICPPDGEEREWSQRAMVRTARRFAAMGHPVLRFDFMGQGRDIGSNRVHPRGKGGLFALRSQPTQAWAIGFARVGSSPREDRTLGASK